jgi:hypothetical protein
VKIGELRAAAPQNRQWSIECRAHHESMMAQLLPHGPVLSPDHGEERGKRNALTP